MINFVFMSSIMNEYLGDAFDLLCDFGTDYSTCQLDLAFMAVVYSNRFKN